jgi:glycosyltransferase involved in cell wall biosynthesis
MSKEKTNLLIMKVAMPIGGAETLILQHLQNINRLHFNVHFVTLTNNGVLLEDAKKLSDQYDCLNRRAVLDPLSILKLRGYIIRNRIEVVHCHDWITAFYLYACTKRIAVKKIATIHSQAKSWQNNLTYFLLKSFDKIVTVSNGQKLNFFENGIQWSKMEVVYNCLDMDRFVLLDKNIHEKNSDIFKMVMVGNFCWQKDHKTLIEAINIVRSLGYKIELHLTGGRNKKLFEKNQRLAQELDLLSIITFHTNKRVDGSFLSKFDLFVFSTKSERLPIAPIEAMACSLPVLVSDIYPNMELIGYGHDGFYFETGNSFACSDKIIEIMKNPIEVQNKIELGHNRAKEFYPEIIIEKLEKCYWNTPNPNKKHY